MRVLVTGAAGFLGRHIVRTLQARGHLVRAHARDGARLTALHPEAEPLVLDYGRATDSAVWLPHLRDVDVVVNAVGLLRGGAGPAGSLEVVHERAAVALFEACREAGVRRIVQISALGAGEGKGRYFATKRAADEALVRIAEADGCDWVVLRPSLVIGPGGDSTALFAALAAGPVLPRIGAGRSAASVQPIGVADLANAVVALVERAAPIRAVLDAVGPAPITTDELLRAFRRWVGRRPAPFVPVPWAALSLAGAVGGLLPRGPVTSETVAMLRRGSVGDPRPLTEATGIVPRPLAGVLAGMPATRAERQGAGLYFLRLPLRWSLAALWIWTGLVSLGLYPLERSYELLAAAGIEGGMASVLLFGGAAVDLLLGLLLLLGWRPVAVGAAQIALIAAYTLIITAGLPDLWLEPFGPVSKNVPIVAATLVMMALEA